MRLASFRIGREGHVSGEFLARLEILISLNIVPLLNCPMVTLNRLICGIRNRRYALYR